MKKIALFALALMTLTACETVDENERWNKEQTVEMKKNVLIEDFTGQKCVNCPNAAALISNLSATSMGEHIVAVSIHGGSMSLSCDNNPMGLATTYGNDYNEHWGVQAWPSGMVDRKGGLLDYTSWTSAIVDRLSEELVADLDIETSYNADTRDLNVNVKITPVKGDYTSLAPYSLTVWLTQSGIEGYQLLPDGSTDMKYIHNHVLRDCLTDAYGTPVEAEGKDAEMSYWPNNGPGIEGFLWSGKCNIPEKYGKCRYTTDPANMAIVAFITNLNGEVLQVVDKAIQ